MAKAEKRLGQSQRNDMKKMFIMVILIVILVGIVLLMPKKQTVQNIQTDNVISNVTPTATPKVTEQNINLKSVDSDLNNIDINSMDSDLNQLNSDASTF